MNSQAKRRVEDESDKLRDVSEEEKQVDPEISNREHQDEEEKDEGEKHVDTEKANREPQDENEKGKGDGMLKIHAWRGKHQGWVPKKSM